jgi:hypothetical protein
MQVHLVVMPVCISAARALALYRHWHETLTLSEISLLGQSFSSTELTEE